MNRRATPWRAPGLTSAAGVAALAMAASLATRPAHANQVVNGDFESPLTATFTCFANNTVGGWTNVTTGLSSGSCITRVDGPAPAAWSGQQSVYLNDSKLSGTVLQQGLALPAGSHWQLSFAMTGITDRPTSPVVLVGLGNGTAAASFAGKPFGQWQVFNQGFVADASGITPLSFTSVFGNVYLDAVSITAVPEPSAAAMLALGLALLSAAAARRQRGPAA